jgi:hypothetical protein
LKKEALLILEASNLFQGRYIDEVANTGHFGEHIHCEVAKNSTFQNRLH